MILDYLECSQLRDKFHMDEAWDSPHNLSLLDEMPAVYRSPHTRGKNTTPYRVFVGGGAIFSPIQVI